MSPITDVVPANFLCDRKALSKIAKSKKLDERALSELEEKLPVLRARLQWFKEQTEGIEKLVADAEAEQTRLCSSIATHTSLLSSSPLRALPGEVLSEIFLHYIALSSPRTTRNTFKDIVATHRIHNPILQVCRRWRTTALADPRLWTIIPLAGSDDGQNSARHPLISGSPAERSAYWRALETRIERTSTLSLNVLFHLYTYGSIGDSHYAISAFQIFFRLFPRAHTVSLDLSSIHSKVPDLVDVIKDVQILQARGLHTAKIYLDDASFVDRVLSAMPNVEILEIRFLRRFPVANPGSIDSSKVGHRLRSLILSYATLPLLQLLDILDRAPRLETLKVYHISHETHGDALRVVAHPLISTFALGWATSEENDALFDHVTFPALDSLSYTGSDADEDWPRPSNITFLQRSCCKLSTLSFRGCQVEEDLLMKLFALQKNIITLELNFQPCTTGALHYSIISKSVVESLSKSWGKRKEVKRFRLQWLRVLRVSVLTRNLKTVQRLVRSRHSGCCDLGELDILVHTNERDGSQRERDVQLFKCNGSPRERDIRSLKVDGLWGPAWRSSCLTKTSISYCQVK